MRKVSRKRLLRAKPDPLGQLISDLNAPLGNQRTRIRKVFPLLPILKVRTFSKEFRPKPHGLRN